MAMNQDENLDEQALLQQLGAGGGQPQSGTLPVGAPAPFSEPAAPSGNSRDTRAALGGYAGKGTMLGFNQGDYGGDAKAANSVKNTFGRIASRYEAKPSSMKLIANDPDFQRYFAGATFDDKDRLHLPAGMMSDFEGGVDVGSEGEGIDVLGSSDPANDTAAGWTWQDLKNDGGGMGPQGGAGGGLDINALLGASQGAAGGGDGQQTLDEILAEIAALSGGENTPMDLKALLAQMGGQ